LARLYDVPHAKAVGDHVSNLLVVGENVLVAVFQ
jgi:hypothetical protein